MHPALGLVLMAIILILVGRAMARGMRFATVSPVLDGNPRAALTVELLPILCYGLWGAKLNIDLLLDPASHNLWPFELVIALFLWLAYALVLWVALRAFAAVQRIRP